MEGFLTEYTVASRKLGREGLPNRSSRKMRRDCRIKINRKYGRDFLLNIASRKLGGEGCRIQSIASRKLGREGFQNIAIRKLGSEGLQNRASRGAGVRNDICNSP
jgi:hypothetical protein